MTDKGEHFRYKLACDLEDLLMVCASQFAQDKKSTMSEQLVVNHFVQTCSRYVKFDVIKTDGLFARLYQGHENTKTQEEE